MGLRKAGAPLFEQAFKNIDDVLHKDAGSSSELDYTEQTSWLLFLKYLDALDPLTRVKRAADARGQVRLRYTDRQQAFVDFVLDHYTKEGVGELDGDKLAPPLKLRYKNAISDALADLGNAEQIRGLFIGFQRYLYEPSGRPVAT